MSNVITGIEAVRQARGIIKCDETKIILTTVLVQENTCVTLYEFLGDFYFSSLPDNINLSIFEKITREEAEKMVSDIKGLSRIGTYFEFGGF